MDVIDTAELRTLSNVDSFLEFKMLNKSIPSRLSTSAALFMALANDSNWRSPSNIPAHWLPIPEKTNHTGLLASLTSYKLFNHYLKYSYYNIQLLIKRKKILTVTSEINLPRTEYPL